MVLKFIIKNKLQSGNYNINDFSDPVFSALYANF